MARFYDPKNDRELSRVEAILRHGGIEYFLRSGNSAAAAEEGMYDKVGNCPRVVQVQERYIELERFITGDRYESRVVMFAATEKGCAAIFSVEFDLG